MNAWPDFTETPQPAPPPSLAFFVSAHGFGHAARACAVMNALQARAPRWHFHVFTQVPEWFFRESVTGALTYYAAPTDVGLVQPSALVEDWPATLERLDAFYPLAESLVQAWANWLARLECVAVLCDIAPLGLAAAQAADLPSILIENFTWDWLYAGYAGEEPRWQAHIAYLQQLFAQADYHIQATPFCAAAPRAYTVAPISRLPRQTRATVRQRLNIPDSQPLVLVTMGGLPNAYAFYECLRTQREIAFVIPGAHEALEQQGNVWLLPPHSAFYHPDLVAAADVVIGKAGYSTVAEAFQAGVAFGYVSRPRFRESAVLAAFIETHMRGQAIADDEFATGAWARHLPQLLAEPVAPRASPNGADQVAAWVLETDIVAP
jgi:UDP:flavonoid glycosyltransferase YjiC (YdhE family)